MACGSDSSSPLAAARIDYVAGAIEPILTRGQHVVIEGFGFGDSAGSVLFTRIGGGTIAVPVADSAWSPFIISTLVPDSAALGREALGVQTASGATVLATVHVLPRTTFDPATLSWTFRAVFPGSPVGVGLTAASFPGASLTLQTTLYAVGGDSAVFVSPVTNGGAGAIGVWRTEGGLPGSRAFAATVVATRYNSRFIGSALYVIGGTDAAGHAQSSVLAADVTADSVTGHFVFLEPLPAPVAGALAVVRDGRIYVIGGTDDLGRPQSTVYTGRIRTDGHIDGWFAQPSLPGPRAYGAGLIREGKLLAIGGVADSVPPGGGLDTLGTQRLVTGDTAAVSPVSGFFTGPWGAGPSLLPAGRSQFALLDLDATVLIVGGIYAGARANAAETLAGSFGGDSIGTFAGPVGTNRIADLTCLATPAGTLVGPAGVSWREADGTARGIVLGGVDLATGAGRTCVWGF
ncbi:MAG TPA: hypothetical protein VIV83_14945 [Gemmatimonadales bacterium]|jgi:hypothetical protein